MIKYLIYCIGLINLAVYLAVLLFALLLVVVVGYK